MSGTLEGKVALVTGAGSGIGRVAAQAFAREGAVVAMTDVVAEGGQETLRLIEEAGGKGMFVQGDVSVAADVQAIVRAVEEQHGRLDCAFNNAGIEGEPGTDGRVHRGELGSGLDDQPQGRLAVHEV
jgi:NAD(P)-dependent dehydrogenase (short-subunit alcohol dehydrogenase family)